MNQTLQYLVPHLLRDNHVVLASVYIYSFLIGLITDSIDQRVHYNRTYLSMKLEPGRRVSHMRFATTTTAAASARVLACLDS